MSVLTAGRRGFTLFDMLIVLAIIAAVMSVVLPRFTDTTYERLLAAAVIVTSDLEYAQSESVARPDDPMVVRFEAAPVPRYWLARSSAPDDPVDLNDGSGPYEVIFGHGRALHVGGVAATCTPGGSVAYDAMGAIAGFSEPAVTLRAGTREIRLEISPTTGSITRVGE